jgi:hypothetical protein
LGCAKALLNRKQAKASRGSLLDIGLFKNFLPLK